MIKLAFLELLSHFFLLFCCIILSMLGCSPRVWWDHISFALIRQEIGLWKPHRHEGWRYPLRGSLAHCPSTERHMVVCLGRTDSILFCSIICFNYQYTSRGLFLLPTPRSITSLHFFLCCHQSVCHLGVRNNTCMGSECSQCRWGLGFFRFRSGPPQSRNCLLSKLQLCGQVPNTKTGCLCDFKRLQVS